LEHEPSGLLGDPDLLAELKAGDALPSGYKQVHGIEPLVQRNVAALEDRACTDREIKGTGIAAIEANLGLLADALTALALRAERAIRPEPRFQVESRRLGIGKHLEQLEGADCGSAHKRLPFFPGGSLGENVAGMEDDGKGIGFVPPIATRRFYVLPVGAIGETIQREVNIFFGDHVRWRSLAERMGIQWSLDSITAWLIRPTSAYVAFRSVTH
jgi:hypothetical protein